MSKIVEIFNYMRECPQLQNLWSIAGEEIDGSAVIIPQGTSETARYDDKIDVCGNYECDIIPSASIYEDYQINCYTFYDGKDSSAPSSNVNVASYDEVQAICDWINDNDNSLNFPSITGEKVVSIECNPYMPRVRFIDEAENIIGYYITIRIRYVNKRRKGRSVTYDFS